VTHAAYSKKIPRQRGGEFGAGYERHARRLRRHAEKPSDNRPTAQDLKVFLVGVFVEVAPEPCGGCYGLS